MRLPLLFGMLLFFCAATLLPANETLSPRAATPRDFYLLSIPKSGTHLINKLLFLLTDRKYHYFQTYYEKGMGAYRDFKQEMLSMPEQKRYYCNHPYRNIRLMERFAQDYPEKLVILQIRDLRDVLVSAVYFFDHELTDLLGKEASFEERLNTLLTGDNWMHDALEVSFQKTIEWMKHPNAFVCRFEDLVGAKGGGSDAIQRQTIKSLAHKLGVKLSKKELYQVQEQLFGNEDETHISWTFRKGQIGEWEERFDSNQLATFYHLWGEYQQALGYPVK